MPASNSPCPPEFGDIERAEWEGGDRAVVNPRLDFHANTEPREE